jgi:hypothetical protein
MEAAPFVENGSTLVPFRVLQVNGADINLSVPAQIVAGKTVVPLRFVSENAGAKVSYDDATKKIYVTRSGKYDSGNIMFSADKR